MKIYDKDKYSVLDYVTWIMSGDVMLAIYLLYSIGTPPPMIDTRSKVTEDGCKYYILH